MLAGQVRCLSDFPLSRNRRRQRAVRRCHHSYCGSNNLIVPKEPKGALKVNRPRGCSVNAARGMLIRKGQLLNLDLQPKLRDFAAMARGESLRPAPRESLHDALHPEVCGIRYDGSTMARRVGLILMRLIPGRDLRRARRSCSIQANDSVGADCRPKRTPLIQ